MKIIITALFIFALQLHAFAVSPKQNIFTENISHQKKVDLSKFEKKLARNLTTTFKFSKDGKLNKTIITNLHKDLKRSKTFKDYRIWTTNLIKIIRTNKINKLARLCVSLARFESSNEIATYLNNNTVNSCFKKYIQKLSRLSKYSFNFHRLQAKYIKFNASKIIKPDHLSEIELLLASFKIESKKHKLYSKLFTNHYIIMKQVPPKDLLRYLVLTPDFTRYIQTRELEIYNTQYTFYNELKKLKKKTYDLVQARAPKKNIKKSYDQLYTYLTNTFESQPKEKALLTLLSISKSLTRKEHYDLSRKGLEKILAQKNFYFDDSIFEYLWTFKLQKDYSNGLKQIAKFLPSQEYLKNDPRMHFWMSYFKYKSGQKKQALTNFRSLIKNDPLNFYAILSAKFVSKESLVSSSELYKEILNTNSREPASTHSLNRNWLKRIIAWGDNNNSTFLNLEIKNLQKVQKKSYLAHNLMAATYNLNLNEDYLESFKILYKALNNGDIDVSFDTLKLLFPKPFFPQIKKNSQSFDPIIALSLIRQESGFNTKARSHVGARGLMQLMPATARRFKRRLKTKSLYNPNLNIYLGTKYFNKLMSRYDNNLVYSLAAYNAGEGRVDRWQNDYLNSESILENIENIPFFETRKYVKLIFRNIFFYKMMAEAGHTHDSKDFNRIYDIHVGFNK